MRALALDPATGDLALTAGRLSLVEGVEAIAQRLDGRLSLWQGEWFGDLAAGVPYRRFLGEKGAERLAESSLRQAIATCPGVSAVEAFTFSVDKRTRAAALAFRARTVTGEIIERGPFVVGAR